LVLGLPWVGLQNPIFGLRKISLVIGFKVKGKTRRNVKWVVLHLGDELKWFYKISSLGRNNVC
jgi:hypothetical protein